MEPRSAGRRSEAPRQVGRYDRWSPEPRPAGRYGVAQDEPPGEILGAIHSPHLRIPAPRDGMGVAVAQVPRVPPPENPTSRVHLISKPGCRTLPAMSSRKAGLGLSHHRLTQDFGFGLILGYFMPPGRAGLGPCHCRGSREIVVFSVTFAQPSSSFAIPVQPSTHLRRRPQSANSIQGRPVGRRPLNPVRRGAGVPSPIRPGDGPSPARRGEGPKPRAKWGGMTGGVRSPARRGDME